MLILVAITINVALNGGLFEYAGKAGKETRLAALEEQLYSAYMEEIMNDYANGTDNASFANAIAKVNTNGEYEIIPIVSDGVTGINLSESSITVATEGEGNKKVITATPVDETGETNYYVVEDGKHYKINYNKNGLIKVDKEPSNVDQSGNTLSVQITNTNVPEGSITGNSVEIVGKSVETETTTPFKVKYGANIEASGTITVVPAVTITFNLNGGNISGNTENAIRKGLPEISVNIPTGLTKEGVEFKGWYDAAENGNLVFAKTATTTKIPNSNLTCYAQWKVPNVAFRTYGDAVATGITAGTYGTIGTRVYLGPNNTQLASITVGGTNTIEDNWKVFYEDEDFIYLIYGDYYPVNVQTNSDFSTISFGGKFAYAVHDSSSRANLLKYLRNNSAYS